MYFARHTWVLYQWEGTLVVKIMSTYIYMYQADL